MDILIESDTKEFIRRLPDISEEPPTVHLAMLVVRSKKAKEFLGVKIKDLVVERDIIRHSTFWRDRYFSKIYNLAVLQHLGLYDLKTEQKDIPKIPTEAMGIVATLSPRNVFFAIADLMKENIQYLYQRDTNSCMELTKEYSRFFGFLHKHKNPGTHFVTLDIDILDRSVYNKILDDISSFKIFMATETSGGYHIVLDLSASDDAKRFYGQEMVMQKIGLKYNAGEKTILEFQRDSQEPVPGTLYHRKGSDKPYYIQILT